MGVRVRNWANYGFPGSWCSTQELCSAVPPHSQIAHSSSVLKQSSNPSFAIHLPEIQVSIDFFDPWKLQAAYDTVYDALEAG